MTTAVVHIRSNAAGKIRREKREGRDTIILPSYAAKSETVLNGILYTHAELDKSIAGLNRTPAPLGHPMLNGKYARALDPEALARSHVFAWNENPRWDGDRIALDVVIDEARAAESEGGKQVLNAIAKEKPISTSTGLHCTLETANADTHKAVATGIMWDHVAILLNEAPAITTDQGVGIFVNASGEDVEVVNSSLEDEAERELDWAVDSLARALDRKARVPLLEQLKSAIMRAILGETEPEKDKDTMDKEQFAALSGKVDALTESMKGLADLGETITNAIAAGVKPLTDQMQANADAAKAQADAAKAKAVDAVVNAGLLTKELAEASTVEVLNALAEKAKPAATPTAFRLNGAFKPAGDTPAALVPKE